MTIPRMILLLGLLASPTAGLADEPRPSILLRLDRPDRQALAIIDLFRESRAPHPAAALAAWKRASREPNRLGKPLEAVVAAINPEMAGEIRTLDGAELALWFGPEGGRVGWGICLPEDDGSFAALATSLVLSGGAAEKPMDSLAVDRLGPSGFRPDGPRASCVAGRGGRGKACNRLESGRIGLAITSPAIASDSRWNPPALDGSNSLALRRLGVALRESRSPISGATGLVGSSATATLAIGVDRPAQPAAVDPAWLDWLPIDRAMAAFAVAIDPAPATWDAAFRVADKVEKVDPARENMAPFRLRLGLLARALGLPPDGDLLPHLKGVSGWFGGGGRSVDRACLVLHLADEALAVRVFEGVKPLPNTGPDPGNQGGIGPLVGPRLRAGRSGFADSGDRWSRPGAMGWWKRPSKSGGRPDRSARLLFRERLDDPSIAFVAAIWPARGARFPPDQYPPLRRAGRSPAGRLLRGLGKSRHPPT